MAKDHTFEAGRQWKTICEKMKNCKVMNISVLIFSLQSVGTWNFRKCIKRCLFLILLRKTSIFVPWNALIIRGWITPIFARVPIWEKVILICEKSRRRNILDTRVLWKSTINKVMLLRFSERGICENPCDFCKELRYRYFEKVQNTT